MNCFTLKDLDQGKAIWYPPDMSRPKHLEGTQKACPQMRIYLCTTVSLALLIY